MKVMGRAPNPPHDGCASADFTLVQPAGDPGIRWGASGSLGRDKIQRVSLAVSPTHQPASRTCAASHYWTQRCSTSVEAPSTSPSGHERWTERVAEPVLSSHGLNQPD